MVIAPLWTSKQNSGLEIWCLSFNSTITIHPACGGAGSMAFTVPCVFERRNNYLKLKTKAHYNRQGSDLPQIRHPKTWIEYLRAFSSAGGGVGGTAISSSIFTLPRICEVQTES
jgi:hypothetical protein